MALKLDNTLLDELGLGALPEQEKQLLLRQIYERLEMNVGMRLANQMSNEQLDEFERFVEANDDKGAFQWLETNFPNYKQVVNEEFEKLKAEIRQYAPQMLAVAAQNTQAGPAPVQQMPAGPSPYGQPGQGQYAYPAQGAAQPAPQAGYPQQPHYQQPYAPQQPPGQPYGQAVQGPGQYPGSPAPQQYPAQPSYGAQSGQPSQYYQPQPSQYGQPGQYPAQHGHTSSPHQPAPAYGHPGQQGSSPQQTGYSQNPGPHPAGGTDRQAGDADQRQNSGQ